MPIDFLGWAVVRDGFSTCLDENLHIAEFALVFQFETETVIAIWEWNVGFWLDGLADFPLERHLVGDE